MGFSGSLDGQGHPCRRRRSATGPGITCIPMSRRLPCMLPRLITPRAPRPPRRQCFFPACWMQQTPTALPHDAWLSAFSHWPFRLGSLFPIRIGHDEARVIKGPPIGIHCSGWVVPNLDTRSQGRLFGSGLPRGPQTSKTSAPFHCSLSLHSKGCTSQKTRQRSLFGLTAPVGANAAAHARLDSG
ncbi:hypothetical protein LZ30DRAFT_396128 [Colletotrichum cereale]|nr:hypothetical protein LZ30DRAFT_396128 [Colletotrichum cereale]